VEKSGRYKSKMKSKMKMKIIRAESKS